MMTASVGCSADGDNVYRALLESNLTTEVGLVVLDTVGVFCAHFADAVLALDGDNALMRKVRHLFSLSCDELLLLAYRFCQFLRTCVFSIFPITFIIDFFI